MRKAWRLPVGSVFIHRSGDPVFNATVTKIGWNRWLHHFTDPCMEGEKHWTNRQVEYLIARGSMELIRDHR